MSSFFEKWERAHINIHNCWEWFQLLLLLIRTKTINDLCTIVFFSFVERLKKVFPSIYLSIYLYCVCMWLSKMYCVMRAILLGFSFFLSFHCSKPFLIFLRFVSISSVVCFHFVCPFRLCRKFFTISAVQHVICYNCTLCVFTSCNRKEKRKQKSN